MGKGEISWKGRTPEGVKRELYAHRTGREWKFFIREKRFDEWQRLPHPTLDDWMELLDGVRRRIARRQIGRASCWESVC